MAAARESAISVPLLRLPSLVNAVYAKTDIVSSCELLAGGARFGHLGAGGGHLCGADCQLFVLGHTQNFFGSRTALADHSPAVFAQALHILADRHLADIAGTGTFQYQSANLVADRHHFEQGLAATVAGALAVSATAATVDCFGNLVAERRPQFFGLFRRGRFLAFLANQ